MHTSTFFHHTETVAAASSHISCDRRTHRAPRCGPCASGAPPPRAPPASRRAGGSTARHSPRSSRGSTRTRQITLSPTPSLRSALSALEGGSLLRSSGELACAHTTHTHTHCTSYTQLHTLASHAVIGLLGIITVRHPSSRPSPLVSPRIQARASRVLPHATPLAVTRQAEPAPSLVNILTTVAEAPARRRP